MKRILVTGGAGFIGSNIAGTLANHTDYRVVVADHFGTDDKWRNLAKHRVYEIIPPAEIFYWLEANKNELDAIIHMGAISSTTETDVDLILETNFALSRGLWNWAAQNKKRLIYASSAATYGDGSEGFKDDLSIDALVKLKPLNPYGWSKQLFDQFVSIAANGGEKLPSQWVGLKFFNVYGPNEYHKGDQRSVINQIFPHAEHGRPVKLFKSYNAAYKDGEQLRDFIYVKDCVKVIAWLLGNPAVNGLYNLGAGKARSFNDLAQATFAALGKTPQINYFDMPENLRDKYQYRTEADMTRLRAAGYAEPFHTLEDGVKDYVQNYLAKEDSYF
ncbi:MAG: ADP-glyceromanno-heptose 6-epimerase [Rickettsiales bacterium]